MPQTSLLRRLAAPATIVLLIAFCSALAGAQDSNAPAKDYALIYGTVWGPDNTPVAGVPVSIRRATDKKAKWQLVSDRRGEFAQRVPPGKQDYIIVAEIKVAKGEPKPQVMVAIDDNERKDVGLHLPAPRTNQKQSR